MENNYSEITKRKTLDSLFESAESFANLLEMLLIFNRNSIYSEYTGIVTAALLDFEKEETEKFITVFAIHNGKPGGWYTIKDTKENIKVILKDVDAFIGKTLEESFILERE